MLDEPSPISGGTRTSSSCWRGACGCRRRGGARRRVRIGHWSATLAPHLHAGALTASTCRRLAPRARERLEGIVGPHRLELVHSRAEHLPFEQETFDLATCQTLLVHVPDPLQVLHEMRRVLKPEEASCWSSPTACSSTWGPTARRRSTTSTGSSSCASSSPASGDDTPWATATPGSAAPAGAAARDGFADVRAWLCDRVRLLSPPYHDPYSHALLALIQGLYDRAEYPFPKERGRAYFVAGGGAPEDFEAAWQRRRDDQAHFLALTHEGAVSATVVGRCTRSPRPRPDPALSGALDRPPLGFPGLQPSPEHRAVGVAGDVERGEHHVRVRRRLVRAIGDEHARSIGTQRLGRPVASPTWMLIASGRWPAANSRGERPSTGVTFPRSSCSRSSSSAITGTGMASLQSSRRPRRGRRVAGALPRAQAAAARRPPCSRAS